MAATIAQVFGGQSAPLTSSKLYVAQVDVTGDTSYPTGGYAFVSSTYVPTGARILDVLPTMKGGGFVPQWNAATAKVMLYSSNGAAPAALVEVANTTNVSAAVTRLNILYEI